LRIWRFGDSVTGLREALDRGGILAIPTESSYGLAADPRSEQGVRAIYQVKGRDTTKALPVVAGDADQLGQLGIDPAAFEVAVFAACWPAALSVVARTAQPLPAGGGEDTLAVRVPAHRSLRDLLHEIGRPLPATSANRAGEPPILRLADLAPLIAGADAIAIDGGDLPGGPPSTLVALRGGAVHVLRQGRFPVADLRHFFSTASVEISVENAS
jgi:L-threonylcarbamoyladenylate synthase